MPHVKGIPHDPEDWTPLDWILFTTPFGLGHVAQRVVLGDWGFNALKSTNYMYVYMMFAVAQGVAYTAVGVAAIAPTATLGHVRHVVAGYGLKAMSGPPVASVAGPMLMWPNVLALEGFFSSRADPRIG